MVNFANKVKAGSQRGSLASGSWPGVIMLMLSLAFAIAFGYAQLPTKEGFAGVLERQWRDDVLNMRDPNSLVFASGDLKGQAISDPQFGVVLKAVVVKRTIKTYLWMETCNGTDCKVEGGWSEKSIDATKFKTKGYANPPVVYQSLAMASRASVGNKAISSTASRALGKFAEPYPIREIDTDIPGFYKVSGSYQSFPANGAPKIGDIKVTYKAVQTGTGWTVAGPKDATGDLTAGKNGQFLANRGAMTPEELLQLAFWQMPMFGNVMLGLCTIFFVAGMFGLSTARKIERQIIDERRKRGDRRVVNKPPPHGEERRQNSRRNGPSKAKSSKPTGKAGPKPAGKAGPKPTGKTSPPLTSDKAAKNS